jgi:hypothetical protein
MEFLVFSADMVLSSGNAARTVEWYSCLPSNGKHKFKWMQLSAYQLIKKGHYPQAIGICKKAMADDNFENDSSTALPFLLLRASILSHADSDAANHVTVESILRDLESLYSSESAAGKPSKTMPLLAQLAEDANGIKLTSAVRAVLLKVLERLLEMVQLSGSKIDGWRIRPLTILRNLIKVRRALDWDWENICIVKSQIQTAVDRMDESSSEKCGSDEEVAYFAAESYNIAIDALSIAEASSGQQRDQQWIATSELFDLSFKLRSCSSAMTETEVQLQQRCIKARCRLNLKAQYDPLLLLLDIYTSIHCRDRALALSDKPDLKKLLELIEHFRSFTDEHKQVLENSRFAALATIEIKILASLDNCQDLQEAFERLTLIPGAVIGIQFHVIYVH